MVSYQKNKILTKKNCRRVKSGRQDKIRTGKLLWKRCFKTEAMKKKHNILTYTININTVKYVDLVAINADTTICQKDLKNWKVLVYLIKKHLLLLLLKLVTDDDDERLYLVIWLYYTCFNYLLPDSISLFYEK